MLSVVPERSATELDAGIANAYGSLATVDVQKPRTTRASTWIAGVSVAVLVTAGFVVTLRSIANSDARAPAEDAGSAYGTALKGSGEAHAKDSPTQAVIANNSPGRRSRSLCPECGVVESIRQIERSGVAGATSAPTAPSYEIRVRFRDGSSTAINQASPQGWRMGSQVIVVGR